MIKSLLSDKTPQEKSRIKACEITKIGSVSRVKRQLYDIEIVGFEYSDQAVDVFVRAWDTRGQIGFGYDGSVDIERFRIFNPPILVPDKDGDIEKVMTDGREVFGVARYREDPKEAITQVVEHNLSVIKNKHGGENIVPGKKGNTTSTFYPNAGTSTAPVDGRVSLSPVGDSFNTIRNAASGDGVAMTFTIGTSGELEASVNTDTFRRLDKMLFGFNINIGTDSVDSATFSLYGVGSTVGLGGGMVIELTTATPTNNDTTTTFVNADYDVAKYGSTRLATGVAVASWNEAGYNDFTLNASGEAYVANGIKYFATRSNWDVDNSFTGTWVSAEETRGLASNADETGTTQDPKLVVEHSAGGVVASFLPTLLLMNVG